MGDQTRGFKPCSTIKLVTGVAGINEKLIDGDGNITGNSMQMNLDDALARSNNAYFQRVGANLGSEKMIDYAKRLGLETKDRHQRRGRDGRQTALWQQQSKDIFPRGRL